MFKSLFLSCLASVFLVCGAEAGQIHISAQFQIHSDVSFPSGDASLWDPEWALRSDTNGKPVYVLEKVILQSELPYVTRLGDAYLNINESGVLSFGLKHAEGNGEIQTSFVIPQLGGKFLTSDLPYVLQAIGGDYAEESWSFGGRVTLKVIP